MNENARIAVNRTNFMERPKQIETTTILDFKGENK